MKFFKYSILFTVGLLSKVAIGQAPKTDTLRGNVIIEKEYKPFLEDGKKQPFQPSMPTTSSNKAENLAYTVPSQFIESSYELDELKPLPIDIKQEIENRNFYLKAGYGSMKNPLAQFAINGSQPQNYTAGILGNFSSLTGNDYDDQKMTDASLQVFGTKDITTASLNANLHYDHNSDHLYGYDHSTIQFNEDEVQQTFHQLGGKIGIESMISNGNAIHYDLNAGFDIVTDDLFDISENQFKADTEISKKIVEKLDIALLADATVRNTKFELNTDDNINSYVVNATPILRSQFNNGLKLEVGASINQGEENDFQVFPHISAEYLLANEQYTLYAGYKGRTENFGIQQLKDINPRFSATIRPHNYTKQVIPVGIKGTFNSNFSFNASVEHVIANNTQLFAIDTENSNENTFQLLEEEKLSTTTPQLQLNYQLGEKVNALADIKYNIYDITTQEKAYQLPDFTTDLNIEVKPIRKLQINLGTEIMTGIETFSNKELDAIFNIEAGAEYSITDNIGIFLQGNNLANQKYERWENYNVAGVNALGGAVLSF